VVDLFVYGTLLDDTVVQQVTGRRFPKHAARLSDYRKFTPDSGYPYIVADEGGAVDGALLCGLDQDALRALDSYEDEGRLYRRIAVTVTVGAQPRSAFAYVAARSSHGRGGAP
jgi:gamma-glutamylcyclotransferase (GGCT)/AIG2-like uncharacterized protein YtfP